MATWRLKRDGKFYIYGTLGITKYGVDGHVLEYQTEQEAREVAAYLANDYGELGWEPSLYPEENDVLLR
jgi:hypothetical protein